MKVNLRYFASIREALGQDREALDTAAPTLGALRNELIARGGDYADSLAHGKSVRVALNQVMADETAPLTEGAEVGFFPPVTGG